MVNLNIDDCRLIIIRHAEAQKNLEKMHGGGTQDLTELGIQTLRRNLPLLQTMVHDNDSPIYCQEEGRSQRTAQIIAEFFHRRVRLAKGISGVGLGVIATLNEDQLEEQYPTVAAALSRWRQGTAKLEDYPDVPGREHMDDFALRIGEGLKNILVPHTDTILVGTTSTINMLNHLMQENGRFVHSRYNFITYPFVGINIWQLSTNHDPYLFFSNF